MKITKKYILFLAVFTMLFSACKEEEVIDNTLKVAFKEFNGAIGAADDELTVELVSSKAATQDLALTIGVSAVCNAVLSDYIFTNESGDEIALAGGIALNITIPAGASSTNFTISTTENGFPVATEELEMALLSVENAELNDSHLLFEIVVGTGSGFFSSTYNNDFSTCGDFGVPADFTLYDLGSKTDKSIFCRDLVDGTAVVANAFGGAAGTVDAWLVSNKKFDFTNASKAVFTVDVASEYDGDGQLEFLWSNNYCGSGDPSDASISWVNLSDLENQLPAGGSKTEVTISANNTTIVGESGYLAIRYSGATNSSSLYYALDNFNLKEPIVDEIVEPVVLLEEHFDAACLNGGIPAEWTSFNVSSDYEWRCSGSNRGASGVDGDYALEMSNFGSPDGGAAEDWLITPQVDVLSNAVLSFTSMKRYAGSTILVLASTDYVPGNNPNDYSWSEFAAATAALDSDESSFDYVASGDISLAAFSGNTYFAFKFTAIGAASGESSTFRVDDLIIGTPGTSGGSGSGNNFLVEDFESCVDNLPAGWVSYSVENADIDWACSTFGEDGSLGVVMNGFFGGAAQSTNDWLISPSIDLTGSGETFQVSIDRRYAGPDLEILYSTDYSGSGDPTSATWTALPGYSSPAAADANNVWNQIGPLDISSIGNAKTYFAFQYTSNPTDGASRYNIDNLLINPDAAGSGGGTGGGTGGTGGGTGAENLFADFETCVDNLPAIWTSFSAENADLNWQCSTFGEDASLAVSMNGFSAGAQLTDDWLISPAVDLSGTGETFKVSMDRRYDGPDLEILFSTDYSGSGDPRSATWTAMPGYTSPAPADANGVWNQIGPLNISSIGNANTYIAFRYRSNPTDGASRYNVDNVIIE